MHLPVLPPNLPLAFLVFYHLYFNFSGALLFKAELLSGCNGKVNQALVVAHAVVDAHINFIAIAFIGYPCVGTHPEFVGRRCITTVGKYVAIRCFAPFKLAAVIAGNAAGPVFVLVFACERDGRR